MVVSTSGGWAAPGSRTIDTMSTSRDGWVSNKARRRSPEKTAIPQARGRYVVTMATRMISSSSPEHTQALAQGSPRPNRCASAVYIVNPNRYAFVTNFETLVATGRRGFALDVSGRVGQALRHRSFT